MKKLLISALVLTLSKSTFSQINKGQWLAGGSVGFESSKYGDQDDTKTTTFQFSPNAGYFFLQNFAGGLRATIQTEKVKGSDADNNLLFAPFVRYYFLPASQKVNILADASYGFGSVKSDGESDGYNQFAFSAGPAIFLSQHTALELLLQYRSAGGDAFGDDRLNNFGVNIGFQVHLGK